MKPNTPLKIAYLTAGAGGMLCGSCMHDNTLARALSRLPNVDCLLVPTYTPIRTDEENVSEQRVFMGGINVYLEQKLPWLRYVPSPLTRWLDHPRLLRWASSRAININPRELGALTVSMLRGARGRQRREMRELCDWLADDLRPDLIVLTNVLIAGFLPELRARLPAKIVVTLQGDDIFLRDLPDPYQLEALREIYRLEKYIDGLLTHSHYYADFMSSYLQLPRDKFHIVPLGIDTQDFRPLLAQEPPPHAPARPPTIGYLARLAPEKGLHLLVDAFLRLRERGQVPDARLSIAGWLGPQHQAYADEQFDKLRQAGLSNAFDYHGTVDRAGKIEFLRDIDVFSVPTVYQDPKGLFVLEALAAGKPVVQPAHGAFPELLGATGGGKLFRPSDVEELSRLLEGMLLDSALRQSLGATGQKNVHQHFHAEAMARHALAALLPLVSPEHAPPLAANF